MELVRKARKIFDTLNVDIVWGILGETLEMLLYDATKAFFLRPHQVTFYPIMPPLIGGFETKIKDEYRKYGMIIKVALAHNYEPSSPWCMEERRSKLIDEYIVKYHDFIGVGVSSIGKVGEYAYINTFSPKKYIRKIKECGMAISKTTKLSKIIRHLYETESAIFGLSKPKKPQCIKATIAIAPIIGIYEALEKVVKVTKVW